jgi:hypothetical protein
MREPKKGRKMITRTQMTLSFPGKSFFNTLIRAIRGNRRMSKLPNTIKRIWIVPRAKIIMALILGFSINLRKITNKNEKETPNILRAS